MVYSVVQVHCVLTNFLSRYSIHHWDWNVEFSYYYCILSISTLISVYICLKYLDVPMLVAYIFLIIISSWWVYLYRYIKIFISCDNFCLKIILSDISMATLALFWLPFAWNIFSVTLFGACVCVLRS